ncbi:MAG: hypothetical protein MUO76_05490, partial [Anaerolineaceae bacterium]|nr:hypothetical protein [Anaerolineaceae bacterium]
WGPLIHIFSLGMVSATVVNASWYFIHQGDAAFLSMFGLLFLLMVVFLILGLKKWGSPALTFLLGIALYFIVNTSGSFAQRGEVVFISFFGLLFFLMVVFLGRRLCRSGS